MLVSCFYFWGRRARFQFLELGNIVGRVEGGCYVFVGDGEGVGSCAAVVLERLE